MVADITDQRRSEEVLHALSARLLQVQDEERRRIARGLHDGALQRLAALEFKLNYIGQGSRKLPPAAQRNLTECLGLVGECCEDLSNLVYLIQPPLLAEQGLGPALRAYVNSFNRRLGPQVNLNFPSRLGRLPVDLETTMFCIAQEALTNIECHSGSATAEILLRRKAGEHPLEVADHGCGISKEILKQLNRGTALPGIGITGMRERVRLLGGLMEICSSSDGTTVKVKMPIKRPRVDGQSA
jgi:two-component system NarL family sensor kinase